VLIARGPERDLHVIGMRSAAPHLALAERLVGPDRPLRAFDAVRIVAGAAIEITGEAGGRLGAGLRGARRLTDHVAVLGCERERAVEQARALVFVPFGDAYESER